MSKVELFNEDSARVIEQIVALASDGNEYVNIVSDPPYGIEDMVGGYGRAGRTIANDRNLSVTHEVLLRAMANIKNGYAVLFYSPRVTVEFLEAFSDYECLGHIVWNKKAPSMGKQIRYQHESIVVYKIGDPPKTDDIFSVLTDYRVGDVHPHEKPVPLMKKLIRFLPKGVVIDPFMGSGSTGVAAKDLGLPFYGVELDENYFKIAQGRINEAKEQKDLFW